MTSRTVVVACVAAAFAALCPRPAAADLDAVKAEGVLRHVGMPYANFVTGSGDGLDIELIQMFAGKLGVRYQFVQADWTTAIPAVCGREVKVQDGRVELGNQTPVRGDVLAGGLTILQWRRECVDYSIPTFPTQVWLITRADSKLTPVQPSGDVEKDIAAVKAQLGATSVMGKPNTCLDPQLYDLSACAKNVVIFPGKLNDIAPAVLRNDADAAILDVPDALIAMEKWPGRIKVIGPISPPQHMAVAFAKSSPALRKAFDEFMVELYEDGTYKQLVARYYPAIVRFYPDFFDAPPE